MALRIFSFVAILLVALVTGLAFAHVLESPARMQYGAHLYITLQQSLYVQWGPPQVGGFIEPAAIAATSLVVFFSRQRQRWLGLAALVLLLLVFPVVFFWFVAPANAGFWAATLPNIPPDWMALRQNWETGHAIRFALQLAALALLVWPLAFSADVSPRASKWHISSKHRCQRAGTRPVRPKRTEDWVNSQQANAASASNYPFGGRQVTDSFGPELLGLTDRC
jgi:hypothetical protein